MTTAWRPNTARFKRPVYMAIAEQFGAAIESGELAPGERLPPQRELADEVGVSLQTLSRAYEELRRRGLVQGEVGRGTYVQPRRRGDTTPFRSGRAPEPAIDLSIYKPVIGAMQLERMKQALAELSADLPAEAVSSFRPTEGLDRHKRAGLDWLRLCGVQTEADRVIVTNGVTPAICISLMTAAKRGGCVATETLGHHTLPGLASQLGLRLVGVEVDEKGIVPGALDKACHENEISVLFTVPNLANPTATLMDEDRRRAIVSIARAHNLYIVEDDVLGPLVSEGSPPFAALAPERTLYMTGFSKCVMPGLRAGYLVAPDELGTIARSSQRMTTWMSTPLMAEIAARWVADGSALEMVRLQRKQLNGRNKLARRTLEGRRFQAHPDGLHLWLLLSEGWRSDVFVARAQEQSIAVAPSSPFIIGPENDVRAVRVSLGSTDERSLERGLRVLHQLMDQPPDLIIGEL